MFSTTKVRVVRIHPNSIPSNASSLPLEALGKVEVVEVVTQIVKPVVKRQNKPRAERCLSTKGERSKRKHICFELLSEDVWLSSPQIQDLFSSRTGRLPSLSTVQSWLADLRRDGLIEVELRPTRYEYGKRSHANFHRKKPRVN